MTAQEEAPHFLPCPFCGDSMEWRSGDYTAHTNPESNCPIAHHGFTNLELWNTRAEPAVKPLVWERHPVGWIAVSAGYAYHIDSRGKRPRITKGIWGGPECEDLEAAKDWCEIDNISRIRGELV